MFFTSLGKSKLAEFTNFTWIKTSLDAESYKTCTNHDHGVSVWTWISRLIHTHAPHIGDDNGGMYRLIFLPWISKVENILNNFTTVLFVFKNIWIYLAKVIPHQTTYSLHKITLTEFNHKISNFIKTFKFTVLNWKAW